MNGRNVVDTSLSALSTRGAGGWGGEVARRLIKHAARNAPSPLVERLEEEWLADLAARQGPMSRLLFGVGCCWATKVISKEYGALDVSAARAATGSKTMTAYAQPDPTFFSRRTAALVAIIGVHVALVYALVTGLGQRFIAELHRPMVINFLPDTRPVETPPPALNVDLVQPAKIDLGPPPEVLFDIGPDPRAIQQVQPTGVASVDTIPAELLPARALVKRVLGGPGKGFPNPDDYYPPGAKRLDEQGNTVVNVCVDPSGRLTAEPKVMQPSGSVRLDEGAIKLAKAGSGHYRATTEDGVPVSSCYGYLIKFRLR